MKKIINGKKYDTETAKYLGEYCKGSDNDLGYYEESLYRKKTGEYFIFGSGGPASKYSKSIGTNSWAGSSEIIPISFERARRWAEENLNPEEYEKIFGEVTDDESKKAITLTLDDAAIRKLQLFADKNGKKISEVINDLINKEL